MSIYATADALFGFLGSQQRGLAKKEFTKSENVNRNNRSSSAGADNQFMEE